MYADTFTRYKWFLLKERFSNGDQTEFSGDDPNDARIYILFFLNENLNLYLSVVQFRRLYLSLASLLERRKIQRNYITLFELISKKYQVKMNYDAT